MKTKSNQSSESRPRSLQLGAARLHARIASRLSSASTSLSSASGHSGSPWSSLRLDLLKAPLTHYRE